MAKDFLNEKDRKDTKDNLWGGSTSHIIKIEENVETPLYFLFSRYSEGGKHWITLPTGVRIGINCGCEKDFNPEKCKIDKHLVAEYAKVKELAKTDEKGAKKLKDKLNAVQRKPSVSFIVAKGQLVAYRERGTGEVTIESDFSKAEFGILPLSKAQFDDFESLYKDSSRPYMQSAADLFNRVIRVKKERKKGASGKTNDYASLEFFPEPNQSKRPEVPKEWVDYDIDSEYTPDPEKIEKALELITDVSFDTPDGLEYADESAVVDKIHDISDALPKMPDDDFEDDIPELPAKK